MPVQPPLVDPNAPLNFLPELPELPSASLVLFSSRQWDGLKLWLRMIYVAQDALFTVLAPTANGMEALLPLRAQMETLMTMNEQFAAEQDRASAAAASAASATDAVLSDVRSEIADLASRSASLSQAIADLAANQPITEAQLQRMRDDSASVEATVAKLTSASTDLKADDTAPPAGA